MSIFTPQDETGMITNMPAAQWANLDRSENTITKGSVQTHTFYGKNTLGLGCQSKLLFEVIFSFSLTASTLCQWSSPLGQHCSDRKRDGRREGGKKQKERERNGGKKTDRVDAWCYNKQETSVDLRVNRRDHSWPKDSRLNYSLNIKLHNNYGATRVFCAVLTLPAETGSLEGIYRKASPLECKIEWLCSEWHNTLLFIWYWAVYIVSCLQLKKKKNKNSSMLCCHMTWP